MAVLLVPVNLQTTWSVIKFYCMVYEKYIFEQKKMKLWQKQQFMENKTGLYSMS